MSRAGVAIPVLLARALRVYGRAVRADLVAGGFGDLPRTASWMLGILAERPRGVAELANELHWTKQATSRLADAAVGAGYLVRQPAANDRRRVVLALAPRGVEAVAVVAAATRRLDQRLGAHLTTVERQLVRRTLTDFATSHDHSDN